MARAKTNVATTELAYKRAVNLKQQGIQAQELFDQARQSYDNAVAAYDSANQGVAQAQALLQQAQNDLDHTTILSPMNGKAVQLNAHEGEVVIPGTMNNPGSVIAVIADLSEILVEADVGETEITGIRLNEPSKVHVDAIPDKEYEGHVAEIGSSAALKQGAGAGMRYFKVKVQFDNPDDRLRPGMTAQVSIITTTSGSALSVPIQSVVERVPPALAKSKTGTDDEDENAPKSKYVFVVKDGKVKMTEVKTGRERHHACGARLRSYEERQDRYGTIPHSEETERRRFRRSDERRVEDSSKRDGLKVNGNGNGNHLIEMRDLTRTYQLGPQDIYALRGVDLDHRSRRVRRHHGSLGIGQVDADEHRRLSRPPVGRPVHPRRHSGRVDGRRRAGRGPQQEDRIRFPDLQSALAHHGAAERRAAAGLREDRPRRTACRWPRRR